MDSRSGDLYRDKAEALEAGVPERYIVELQGPPKEIKRIARRVRVAARNEAAKRRAKRKQQKASRKANRR